MTLVAWTASSRIQTNDEQAALQPVHDMPSPLQDTDNWLDQMMQLGWVVVSTDYVGLGTPGPNQYLIAQSEVRDVVNAVRAARNTPQAEAGSRYATWGHSQGGHSSVWTGHLGEEYAPELDLLGVAAAATTAGPSAVTWLADRFAGRPAPRTCDTPPPVAAGPPAASGS